MFLGVMEIHIRKEFLWEFQLLVSVNLGLLDNTKALITNSKLSFKPFLFPQEQYGVDGVESSSFTQFALPVCQGT